MARLAPHRLHGPTVLALAATVIVGACSAEAASPLPTYPAVPAGWVNVASGEMSLALPPWLIPFDTTGAIFANEVPDPNQQWVQLMAEGPRIAEPRLAAGESLERWLLRRMESPEAGQPTMQQVNLPAGPALQMKRLDSPGTRLGRGLVTSRGIGSPGSSMSVRGRPSGPSRTLSGAFGGARGEPSASPTPYISSARRPGCVCC